MPAPPADITLVQQLLVRAEAEPDSPARNQRVAGLKQYLHACKREARDAGRPRARPTARF